MAKQAEVFPFHASELANLDCIITVNGQGLLPAIARQMQYDCSIEPQNFPLSTT